MKMKKNNLDCYQSVYDWYAERNNINIYMHFLCEWLPFKENVFENRIDICHNLLETFHGIKFTRTKKISEYSSSTIQVVCDGFECEWTDMYLKRHSAHSFVIILSKSKLMTLIDPYFMSEFNNLPISFVESKKVRMYEINFTSPTSSNYLNEVVKIAEDNIKANTFLKMTKLLTDINEHSLDNIGAEFEYDPRLIFVKQISNKYINLQYCFEMISKYYQNFKSVCIYSEKLKKESIILRDLTMKSYIKHEKNVSMLKGIMHSLIQTEEEMINYIVKTYSL